MESDEMMLERLFTYHPPKGDQNGRYDRISVAAQDFAQTILECAPSCEDRWIAINKVREARMMANAAIACNELQ